MYRYLLVFTAALSFQTTFAQQDNTLPSSGNVGVGTLNPSSRLHVNGKMRVDSTMIVEDSLRVNSDMHVTDRMVVDGSSTLRDDVKMESNLILLGDARILGTSKLEGDVLLPNLTGVNGNAINSSLGLLSVKPSGLVKQINMDDFSDALRQIIYTPPFPGNGNGNGPLTICDLPGYLDNPYWQNGPNKLFSECPEVFVGIGTRDPLQSLDVRGNAFVRDHIYFGGFFSPPADPAFLEGYTTLGNASPWMRMTVNDNGTDRTAFLVENNGSLWCTSARVRLKEAIPVPDFVFQKEYELMPLTEVKAFVTEHSHLPGIPSESEIREEGLSLEEMQLKLLQKVEELTLYMIELEEKNAALEAELREVKEEMED